MEDFLANVAFFVGTLIGEGDGDAGIEEGEFSHAVGEDVILISSRREDGVIGPEVLPCAAEFGFTHDFHAGLWLTLGIFLTIDLSVAEDLGNHAVGKGVHAADADAVETTGDLVGAFVKLTAGVEHRHHDLQGGAVFFRVHIHGNATTIVLHNDGVV